MGSVGGRAVGAPFFLVVALFGAGCASPAAPGLASTTTAATDEPTAETGTIRAQVVTTELLAIAKAQVVVAERGLRALTGDDGTAVFGGLEPGLYNVIAAKAGFEPRQPKGRLVTVVAGETLDVRLEMEPALVATAESTYVRTFPLTGFITCTVQVYPAAAQTCGRQAAVSDPNGKSNHVWEADSPLAQTLVIEARWTPAVGVVPFELSFSAYRTRSCTSTGCSFSDSITSAKGPSPLYAMLREDSTNNLTKRLSSPTNYPRELYAEMLVHCPPPSCYASVVAQQRYDAWITVFYGQQAPDKWSILTQS